MLTDEQKCELVALRGAIVEAEEDYDYWSEEHEVALKRYMNTRQVYTGEMLTKANKKLTELEERLNQLVGLRNDDR